MSVTRISDNREFEAATVADADKKFEELARLEIGIKAKKALAEKGVTIREVDAPGPAGTGQSGKKRSWG